MDDFLINEMNSHHLPGLVVAVGSGRADGELAFGKGYGYVKLNYKDVFGQSNYQGIAPDSNTAYRAGYITMVVTAAAVLYLIKNQRELLDCHDMHIYLDDPILKYLRLKVSEDCRKTWDKVTIRHLLTMSSGIPCFEGHTMSYLDYVQQNIDRGLQWYPGSQYQFSDTNYLILGLLIDNLPLKGSIRFPEFVKRFILDPAGARDSYIESASGSLTTPGYEFNSQTGAWKETRPPPRMNGYSARGLVTTARDLVLLDEGIRRLLGDSFVAEMFSPSVQVCEAVPECRENGKSCYCDKIARRNCVPGHSFGMGWFITPECNHMMVKMPGFSGILYYDRKTHTRVALLSNLGGGVSGEETAPFVKIARRVVEFIQHPMPLLIEGFTGLWGAGGTRVVCTGGTGVMVPLVVMFLLLGVFLYLSK